MNFELFNPFDYFDPEQFKPPVKRADINSPYWVKNNTRLSLWSIILTHVFAGDLTVYRVSDKFNASYILKYNADYLEDGYSFKYPVVKKSRDSYFNSSPYKSELNQLVSSSGPGPKITVTINGNVEILSRLDAEYKKNNKVLTFDFWYDSLIKLETNNPTQAEMLLFNKIDLMDKFDKAGEDGFLAEDGPITFQSSKGIVAYNIKEDWFFDKERSILDRRIIAIAPVAEYTDTSVARNDSIGRGQLIVYRDGIPVYFNTKQSTPGYTSIYSNGGAKVATVQKEMFWLYFPELRNVIVNYYIYNDKSDAQWMSFDDLFWKRKFSAMIYKTSDKFDRDIEDYRYGVDALYEAEKVKEEIRKWEHDVWNF